MLVVCLLNLRYYIQVDPNLVLDGDIRLRAIGTKLDDKNCYVEHTDDASAMKSLSEIESKDQQLKDAVSTHLVSCLSKSSEVIHTCA